MKKILFVLFAALLAIGMAACGAPKPDSTVDAYFAAAQKLDVEAMALTIVPSNTEGLERTKNLINDDDKDDYTKYFLTI